MLRLIFFLVLITATAAEPVAAFESDYASKTSIGYNLEKGFRLKDWKFVVDKHLQWKIGAEDFTYNAYPVLFWFDNLENPKFDSDGIENDLRNILDASLQYDDGSVSGLDGLAEKYRRKFDDLVSEILGIDYLGRIRINDMPLGEVVGMFSHFYGFLEIQKEDKLIRIGRELNGSARIRSDSYFSLRDGPIIMEHGVSVYGDIAGKIFLGAEAEYAFNNPLDSGFNGFLKARASAGLERELDYRFSIGESRQFTFLRSRLKYGAGFSREYFLHENKNWMDRWDCALNIDALNPNFIASLTLSNRFIKSYGERNSFYSFIGANNENLWFYGFAKAAHIYENVEIETKTKSNVLAYSLSEGDAQTETHERGKIKKTDSEWESVKGGGVLGVRTLDLLPFIAYNDGIEPGLISNWKPLNGLLVFRDNKVQGDLYLTVWGRGSFDNYFENVYETRLSPMYGASAKLDVLRRNLHSRLHGLYLHGEQDSGTRRLGALVGYKGLFFESGIMSSVDENDHEGLYANIGYGKLMLFGEYQNTTDSRANTYGRRYSLGLSGNFKDKMIDLEYTYQNKLKESFFEDEKEKKIVLKLTIPF